MNILLASAEVTPFAKTGGLADVTHSLPMEWNRHGQNVIVVMPKYEFIDVEHYGFIPTNKILYVPIGGWMEFARLWEGTMPGARVPVYLIENKDYFDRPEIYGDPDEYPDNDRRFIFFSRAVFETARALQFKPDIVHAHDFHSAFAMAFLKSHYRTHPLFSRTAGVFTIHNLAYQGWFYPDRAMQFSGFGVHQFYPGSWMEFHGWVNAMKAGIMFADKITTVSTTYAKEIRTEEYGHGLQDVLNLRGADIIGVLNGVYYNDWNPVNDKYIRYKYNSENIQAKKENKYDFLKSYGYSEVDNLDMPLIGMVTRLTHQKGIDLLRSRLENFLKEGKFRFAMIGSGDLEHHKYFDKIAEKYPELTMIYIGYNNALAHKVIACSDYILMPSLFEPCGLTQLYAMKYGTIPVVRATGGLADTVEEYNYNTAEGTGFLFRKPAPVDMENAINRALRLYEFHPHWDLIRKNAMKKEFSSGETAMEYIKVFKWALEKVR